MLLVKTPRIGKVGVVEETGGAKLSPPPIWEESDDDIIKRGRVRGRVKTFGSIDLFGSDTM